MRTFLVTGGAGFIGSHIAETLVRRGDRVRVLDNLSHRPPLEPGRLPRPDRVHRGRRDRRRSWWPGRSRAWIASFTRPRWPRCRLSVERPLDSHAACATGTVTLLDAARRAGVRRVVYAASSAAYGDQPTSSKRETDLPAPLSPYAAAKAGRRALLPGVLVDLRPGDGGHPLLQRLRPAARPEQPIFGGDSAVHHGHARRPAAGDLRRRAAIARFLLRGQRGPCQPAGRRRPGRGRAHDQRGRRPLDRPVDSCWRCSIACWGRRSSRNSPRRGRATSARARPTSRWPASCSATSRKSISRRACGGRSTIIGRLAEAASRLLTFNSRRYGGLKALSRIRLCAMPTD